MQRNSLIYPIKEIPITNIFDKDKYQNYNWNQTNLKEAQNYIESQIEEIIKNEENFKEIEEYTVFVPNPPTGVIEQSLIHVLALSSRTYLETEHTEKCKEALIKILKFNPKLINERNQSSPWCNTVLHALMSNEFYDVVMSILGIDDIADELDFSVTDAVHSSILHSNHYIGQKNILSLAAMMNRTDVLMKLLEIIGKRNSQNKDPVDINQADEKGNTPLHYACIYGNKEAYHKLISLGARINIKNLNGETPTDLLNMTKFDMDNVNNFFNQKQTLVSVQNKLSNSNEKDDTKEMRIARYLVGVSINPTRDKTSKYNDQKNKYYTESVCFQAILNSSELMQSEKKKPEEHLDININKDPNKENKDKEAHYPPDNNPYSITHNNDNVINEIKTILNNNIIEEKFHLLMIFEKKLKNQNFESDKLGPIKELMNKRNEIKQEKESQEHIKQTSIGMLTTDITNNIRNKQKEQEQIDNEIIKRINNVLGQMLIQENVEDNSHKNIIIDNQNNTNDNSSISIYTSDQDKQILKENVNDVDKNETIEKGLIESLNQLQEDVKNLIYAYQQGVKNRPFSKSSYEK